MLLRGFFFLIPVFFLLPLAAGTPGMWLVMPATEFLTAVVIFLSWRLTRRSPRVVS